MQENYLAKWLNNELTDSELEEFKSSKEYGAYQRILEVSGTMESPEFDVEGAFTALKNKQILQGPKVIQLHPFRKFLRVAAAVAVLMIGSYFYLNSLDPTIATQYAENKQIELPDASQVTLNADSRISYSERKWDKERNVSLQGEAFFKVAKGKRFTVSTDDGVVAVLGTQFNVENRKGFFEVICYEGLVSVHHEGSETKLPAGTSFLVINGKVVESDAPSSTIPNWINKESTFKSIPLKFVLDEFQRQHNVMVKTENIDLEQLYTGTFSNTNTDLALQSISVPSRIKFKLDGNKVLFYAENMP